MKTYGRALAVFLVASILCTTHARAQDPLRSITMASKVSAGFSAGHYKYDPGIAIEFTTGAIFQNRLSLRMRANVQWLEAYKAVHNHWISYHTFSTGLVFNRKLTDRTRFYAEFGVLGIVTDSRFSDEPFVKGFYEFNGLEMIILSDNEYTLCLHLGAGPAIIKAKAEKIEGNPRYGDGLHVVSGLRVYFGH